MPKISIGNKSYSIERVLFTGDVLEDTLKIIPADDKQWIAKSQKIIKNLTHEANQVLEKYVSECREKIIMAIEKEDLEVLKPWLVDAEFVLDFPEAQYRRAHKANLSSLLVMAIKKGKISVVEAIINLGKLNLNAVVKDEKAKIMGSRTVPLAVAAIYNRFDMVELLVKKGADPNVGVEPITGIALMTAVQHNHVETVHTLLKLGASIDNCWAGRGAFSRAIEEDNQKIIDLFIQFKANVDAIEEDSRSLLSFAVGGGRLETLQKLMKANVNLIDFKMLEIDPIKICKENKESLRKQSNFKFKGKTFDPKRFMVSMPNLDLKTFFRKGLNNFKIETFGKSPSEELSQFEKFEVELSNELTISHFKGLWIDKEGLHIPIKFEREAFEGKNLPKNLRRDEKKQEIILISQENLIPFIKITYSNYDPKIEHSIYNALMNALVLQSAEYSKFKNIAQKILPNAPIVTRLLCPYLRDKELTAFIEAALDTHVDQVRSKNYTELEKEAFKADVFKILSSWVIKRKSTLSDFEICFKNFSFKITDEQFYLGIVEAYLNFEPKKPLSANLLLDKLQTVSGFKDQFIKNIKEEESQKIHSIKTACSRILNDKKRIKSDKDLIEDNHGQLREMIALNDVFLNKNRTSKEGRVFDEKQINKQMLKNEKRLETIETQTLQILEIWRLYESLLERLDTICKKELPLIQSIKPKFSIKFSDLNEVKEGSESKMSHLHFLHHPLGKLGKDNAKQDGEQDIFVYSEKLISNIQGLLSELYHLKVSSEELRIELIEQCKFDKNFHFKRLEKAEEKREEENKKVAEAQLQKEIEAKALEEEKERLASEEKQKEEFKKRREIEKANQKQFEQQKQLEQKNKEKLNETKTMADECSPEQNQFKTKPASPLTLARVSELDAKVSIEEKLNELQALLGHIECPTSPAEKNRVEACALAQFALLGLFAALMECIKGLGDNSIFPRETAIKLRDVLFHHQYDLFPLVVNENLNAMDALNVETQAMVINIILFLRDKEAQKKCNQSEASIKIAVQSPLFTKILDYTAPLPGSIPLRIIRKHLKRGEDILHRFLGLNNSPNTDSQIRVLPDAIDYAYARLGVHAADYKNTDIEKYYAEPNRKIYDDYIERGKVVRHLIKEAKPLIFSSALLNANVQLEHAPSGSNCSVP